MSFLIEYQFPLIFGCFLAGLIGWLFVLARPAASRAWKLADLVWVGLGGFGVLAAVVAGVYRADTGRIERQIDLGYAALSAFDHDASRFRLRYCEGDAAPDARVLCDKIEFLHASTAANRTLPIFLESTRVTAPLQALRLFAGSAPADMQGMSHAAMMAAAQGFNPDVLAFQATDAGTAGALARLTARPDQRSLTADFQVLAGTYDELIAQVRSVKVEWDYLQAHTLFLAVQIFALCLVAFAAPFRLGKSLAELRGAFGNDS